MKPIKVVVVGKVNVGKTSLVLRLVNNVFSRYENPTIGASFFTLGRKIDDEDMKIHIWDTAGQERYDSLVPMYMRGADIILICSDEPDPDIFKHYINLSLTSTPECTIILVLTKIDDEEVFHNVEDFAEYNQYDLVYTSALTGKGTKNLEELLTGKPITSVMHADKIIISNEIIEGICEC